MSTATEIRRVLGLDLNAPTNVVVAELKALQAVTAAAEPELVVDDEAVYLEHLRRSGVETGAVRGVDSPQLTIANMLHNVAEADGPAETEGEYLQRLAEAERVTGFRFGDGRAA